MDIKHPSAIIHDGNQNSHGAELESAPSEINSIARLRLGAQLRKSVSAQLRGASFESELGRRRGWRFLMVDGVLPATLLLKRARSVSLSLNEDVNRYMLLDL
jgi:hypothetical protein